MALVEDDPLAVVVLEATINGCFRIARPVDDASPPAPLMVSVRALAVSDTSFGRRV